MLMCTRPCCWWLPSMIPTGKGSYMCRPVVPPVVAACTSIARFWRREHEQLLGQGVQMPFWSCLLCLCKHSGHLTSEEFARTYSLKKGLSLRLIWVGKFRSRIAELSHRCSCATDKDCDMTPTLSLNSFTDTCHRLFWGSSQIRTFKSQPWTAGHAVEAKTQEIRWDWEY
jgi:hypothetical protein